MAANLSAYDAVLKYDYQPTIVEQLNQASPMLDLILRDEERVDGKLVYIALHTRRNQGIGARGENENLPTAGAQGWTATTFPLRYHYGRIEIPGPLLFAAQSNKGAFVRALDAEIQGMERDFRKDVCRAVYGDGKGKLATCGAVTAANIIPVDSIKYLDVDMYVDIYTAAGTAVASGRKITAIDEATPSITIDGAAVTTSATDIIVRAGSYDRELHGLGIIVSDTGTLQGIDSSLAVNRWWRAAVKHNSGTLRALSEPLMQEAWDAVEDNEAEVSFMTTTSNLRRSYISLLTSLKRFVNTIEIEGGVARKKWRGPDFNDKPIIVDPDCVPNTVYFLDGNHLKFYQAKQPGWAEEDGAVLSRVSGKDAYEAFLFWYVELGTDKRNAFAALKDVQ